MKVLVATVLMTGGLWLAVSDSQARSLEANAPHSLVAQKGWLAAVSFKRFVRQHHPCLASIIEAETGGTWKVAATNPVSGAYGLGQALPGSKMAVAGRDWRTNAFTQLAWMQIYAAQRYGSECLALAFWRTHYWW